MVVPLVRPLVPCHTLTPCRVLDWAQMPILDRELPPELSAALQGARYVHDTAWNLGPEKLTPNSLRMHTFAGFLMIVFEHHDSTMVLFETGNNDGSAFALTRSIVETFYRGLWMFLCASEQQVMQIRSGGKPYPTFIKMTDAVDQQVGGFANLTLDDPIWKALNGFTHSGVEQLVRRYNKTGDIIPNYPPKEVIQLLRFGTLLLSVMAQFFCIQAGRPSDGNEILASWRSAFDEPLPEDRNVPMVTIH